MKRTFLLFIFKFATPTAFILMVSVSQKWVNQDLDGGPDLYGFPLPFITSTWVNSLEHELYFKGFIIDFLFYLGVSIIIIGPIIHRIRNKILSLTLGVIFWAIAVFVSLPFIILNPYHNYQWKSKYQNETMEKQLYIGLVGE